MVKRIFRFKIKSSRNLTSRLFCSERTFTPFVSHTVLPTDSQRLAGTKIASPAKVLAIHTHIHTHQSYPYTPACRWVSNVAVKATDR